MDVAASAVVGEGTSACAVKPTLTVGAATAAA